MNSPETSIDVGMLRDSRNVDGAEDLGTGVDPEAFNQAAVAQDVEPIATLKPKSKRRSRLSVVLEPAEREARKATLKLRAREQDVGLKRLLAWVAIAAVVIQLLVADAFLAHYVLWAPRAPSDTVLIAWLSASVIEVIGIVAIVARNLFPDRAKQGSSPREQK